MTSITEIQKLNQIAGELKSHFAATTDDAVENARKMIRTNDIDESVFRQEASKVEKEVSKEELVIAMQDNAKYIASQLKAFKEEMASMKTEIDNLRQQITSIRMNAVRQEIQEKPIQQSTAQIIQQAAQQQVQESHPRQGNATEEQVSIEKMFYFGNKKQS